MFHWPMGKNGNGVCRYVRAISVRNLQSCALKFGQLLFQDSGKTIHSAEKNDTSYKWAGFFTDKKQKKNSKWPT